MGGWLEPQPSGCASLDDTRPDGPNFKPFCSIPSVMTIWAAHSRSCESKAVQLWQKLALDYACWWICREKLKYVKIIRVHWEKWERTLWCFMVVCYSIFFFFFQRHKWTEPCILWDGARHGKMVQDSVCFFIPLHMQPMNIIYIMKTSSPI